MAADDAVSLLRSLKAAGEKTGAVEAEGALHLRRNSRRTMDGIHDTIGPLQASPSFNLPASKYQSSASPSAGAGGSINYGNSILIPIASSPVHSANVNNGNYGNGGSLPVITSTASSPIASPSRHLVRPPPTLTSLPSPTNSSPGGSGAAAVAAAGGCSGGPSSPPCLGPPHLHSMHMRRALHTHPSNGSPYDALQLPYSHGSPLPLLFDPPVSLQPPPPPPPTTTTAAAAGAVSSPGVPGVAGAPGSPGSRHVQLSTAAAPPSASSSSLPAIATVGSSGGGGGSASPLSAPMPSLMPSTSLRAVSGRNSFVGGILVAAGGGGGISSGGGGGSSGASPLTSHPAVSSSLSSGMSNTPAGAFALAAAAAAAASGGGGRALRVPVIPGSPFGAPAAAVLAAAAPPSPGSPSTSASASTPGGRLVSPTTLRNGVDLGSAAFCLSSSPVPLPLTPGVAQAALQGQLAAAAAAAAAGQQRGVRPSSARSLAGSSFILTMQDGLNGTPSSRRLSMTDVSYEPASSVVSLVAAAASPVLTAAPSQKLVLAAAHELQHAQLLHHLNSTISGNNSNNTSSYGGSYQQLQLQQLLPQPPQLPSRPSVYSARGLSGAGPGSAVVSDSAASLPSVVPPRDTRSSDPGTCGPAAPPVMAPAAAAATAGASSEFGFPMTAEPPLAGRPSLAPLTSSALQAVRANTPPVSSLTASSPALPLTPNSPSTPPQPNLRAPRPEPLPQRPEPLLPVPYPTALAAAAAAAAAAVALPDRLQPRTESLLPLPEPLPSLTAMGSGATATVAAGPLPLKPVPLGRAGTLAPLPFPEESLTTAPGPVAESSLDPRTPDLDPAALFGPSSVSGSGSGSRAGFMELTVRSMAIKPTSTGAPTAGGGGSEGFTVQSSVRQRLQTDPLRFHPPGAAAALAVRRHSGGGTPYLDPLEATPRLVLGGASVGPPLRTGRGDSTAAAAGAAGDALWAPSQDILPHLVGRVSGSGAASGGSSGGSSSRLCFSPSAAATLTTATPQPPTPGFDLPTSRLRSNSSGSGSGSSRTSDGAPASVQTPFERPPPPRLNSQRAPGGLQSNYLQALAAAAGLDGGSGAAAAAAARAPQLQRQRSLSDSGCSTFLASAAAAGDSGFVGLPLEGGLSVLGDMLSRVRTERHHNVRYSSGLVDGCEPNTTLNRSSSAVREAVAGAGLITRSGTEQESHQHRHRNDDQDQHRGTSPYQPSASVLSSSSGSTPAMCTGSAGDSAAEVELAGRVSGRGLASGSGGFGADVSLGGGTQGNHGSVCGAATHGPAHIRLDTSVSSLPLKALLFAASAPEAPPPALDGSDGATITGAAGVTARAKT